MGKHLNRARLYDVNGEFREAMPMAEAERYVDFGRARRLSRPGERPIRIQLLQGRSSIPQTGTPTSGCTAPACLTAREAELNALSAAGLRADEMKHSVARANARVQHWSR